MPELRLGTRGSRLALAQSQWVAGRLEEMGWSVSLRVIKTTGDRVTDLPLGRVGVKGLFVSEIEQALLSGEVDLAVHSLKDLPADMPDGLELAAVPEREDVRDVIVGRTAPTLDALPAGAVVCTSSLRRRAQLLAARPDLVVEDIRGNVDTRLRKLDEGVCDAVCMAAAGLHRLGLRGRITQYLPADLMVPCPGQGALALQIRSEDRELRGALSGLQHEPTYMEIRAERSVMSELGAGCSIPLGVLGRFDGRELRLTASLCTPDGSTVVREQVSGSDPPEELGRRMAERLKSYGLVL